MTAQDLLTRLSYAQRLQTEQGLSTAAALTRAWYGTTGPVKAKAATPQAVPAETLDELLDRLTQRFPLEKGNSRV